MMRNKQLIGLLAMSITVLSASFGAVADEPSGKSALVAVAKEAAKSSRPLYMRLLRDGKKTPLALQTSIVRCVYKDRSKQDVYVDLVGAVHIGEKAYYQQLNKRFKKYESVLYELVAPEGTRIPKGGPEGGGGSPVSALQVGMKTMLHLEFQLEQIDYTTSNLVHADMTPEEFSRSMKERGESVLQMFFRMMGQGMALQSRNTGKSSSDFKMLMALFSKDRDRRLKILLAEEFESTGGSMYALEGKEGSTIITERNKKALSVLRTQLDMGKKRIAIFYGAGHLSDLEKRLKADFGLVRSKEEWLDAWDLRGTR
jgi:hypothetical protein